MANDNSRLLTAQEKCDIYGIPSLNDAERREYFSFNNVELKVLKRFQNINDAIYFAISLVFFKLKKTLISFTYRDVTAERRHIMSRYFPGRTFPKTLCRNSKVKTRLEKAVLDVCGYKRYQTKLHAKDLKQSLGKIASQYPRQRQLCKTLLDMLIEKRIAIPALSQLQVLVAEIWQVEKQRVVNTYQRHTRNADRKLILSLLEQTDRFHKIISIRKDMKGFNTEQLEQEIKKHSELNSIFVLAKEILPKLRLPQMTVNYYGNLATYYNGYRLREINTFDAQLYLLCYSFNRFQVLNDNLLEAFKHRARTFINKAKQVAKDEAANSLKSLKETRHTVSNLLLAIHNHPPLDDIPRNLIRQFIPEDNLELVAMQLIDDQLDENFLFWRHVDQQHGWIKENLRKLFLAIDFIVVDHAPLQEAVDFVKNHLVKKTTKVAVLASSLHDWLNASVKKYLLPHDELCFHRFEFFLYQQIIHHITTNKLYLQNSIKYKRIDDDLMPRKRWNKDKKKLIKQSNYPKLITPIQKTITEKNKTLTELYHTMQHALTNDKLDHIKLISNNGNIEWRLRPLSSADEENDTLLDKFQQHSIVDVMRFVNNKTYFTRVFEPILPRGKKGELDIANIMAVILANAIRLGAPKIAEISDLNASSLLTTEAAYIREETIVAAIDHINILASKFPIFKKWYIQGIKHASLDGLKLDVQMRHVMARGSSKYFPLGVGVSAYNAILNSFPIAGRLIGSHEYEGHFAFGMVQHQTPPELQPIRASKDKHGMNVMNFGLFDLAELFLMLRIPKPHREKLWGFGQKKDYCDMIIKPHKIFNEALMESEWDNVQHLVISLLTGEADPSVVVSKYSNKNFKSPTKKAFTQYNHIVRSEFLLKYLLDRELQRAVLYALNRGEKYNSLYRSITLLRKGELRGLSEVEMVIWHQCTRLISSIILYYNTYILNTLYERAQTEEERDLIVRHSPCAHAHVNLLGHYIFCQQFHEHVVDNFIERWDWQREYA